LQNTRRLQLEKVIMARELPQFMFYQMGNETYFQGWHAVLTGLLYQLKLVLSEWYPDQMPSLYVTYPLILWKYGENTINSEGVSHAFHTLSNGPGGCVQICHFSRENWDASKTCVGVLFKGILWLEAYAVHLVTGMSIADILDQWKRRQRWDGKKTEFSRLLQTWQEVMTLDTSWSMTR
jgi:hypothetical protein